MRSSSSQTICGCRLVEWNGRQWLRKCKVQTVCEIAGYQIAEAIEIPVQPWLAFYCTPCDARTTSWHRWGMLIEYWNLAAAHWNIAGPAKKHPELVAKALALCVFDRMEWPRWLMSSDDNELRLFDLEFIGPVPLWPPQYTHIYPYRSPTMDFFREARDAASKVGVIDTFFYRLQALIRLDVGAILDFSGHPHASVLKRVMVRGFQARQRMLQDRLAM